MPYIPPSQARAIGATRVEVRGAQEARPAAGREVVAVGIPAAEVTHEVEAILESAAVIAAAERTLILAVAMASLAVVTPTLEALAASAALGKLLTLPASPGLVAGRMITPSAPRSVVFIFVAGHESLSCYVRSKCG